MFQVAPSWIDHTHTGHSLTSSDLCSFLLGNGSTSWTERRGMETEAKKPKATKKVVRKECGCINGKERHRKEKGKGGMNNGNETVRDKVLDCGIVVGRYMAGEEWQQMGKRRGTLGNEWVEGQEGKKRKRGIKGGNT